MNEQRSTDGSTAVAQKARAEQRLREGETKRLLLLLLLRLSSLIV